MARYAVGSTLNLNTRRKRSCPFLFFGQTPLFCYKYIVRWFAALRYIGHSLCPLITLWPVWGFRCDFVLMTFPQDVGLTEAQDVCHISISAQWSQEKRKFSEVLWKLCLHKICLGMQRGWKYLVKQWQKLSMKCCLSVSLLLFFFATSLWVVSCLLPSCGYLHALVGLVRLRWIQNM